MPEKGYRSAWEMIEASNPEMWSVFKSNDVDATIDELLEFKKQHYPDDQRRILTCGIPGGKVRVEWVDPVAKGVDSQLEMKLFGLLRTGQRDKGIQCLREAQGMSRDDAAKEVAMVAAKLGMR